MHLEHSLRQISLSPYASRYLLCTEVLQKRVYKVSGDMPGVACEHPASRERACSKAMPGVEVIADDMIVAEETKEEHDQLLKNLMLRITGLG